MFDRMRDIPDDPIEWADEEIGMQDYQDILDGHIQAEISHGGGEMGEMQDALNEELNKKKQRYVAFPRPWRTTIDKLTQ